MRGVRYHPGSVVKKLDITWTRNWTVNTMTSTRIRDSWWGGTHHKCLSCLADWISVSVNIVLYVKLYLNVSSYSRKNRCWFCSNSYTPLHFLDSWQWSVSCLSTLLLDCLTLVFPSALPFLSKAFKLIIFPLSSIHFPSYLNRDVTMTPSDISSVLSVRYLLSDCSSRAAGFEIHLLASKLT